MSDRSYLGNNLLLDYKHGLKTAVNIGFWWDTPQRREARLELELSLILKWRYAYRPPGIQETRSISVGVAARSRARTQPCRRFIAHEQGKLDRVGATVWVGKLWRI